MIHDGYSVQTPGVSPPDTPGVFASEEKRSALRPRPHPRSGWLIGAVCGLLLGLWAFPPVRYILSAQLQLAFVEDSVPWVRVLDSRRGEIEIQRLDATAAADPDDYLMQIGRATALAESGSIHTSSMSPAESAAAGDDRTLVRLGIIARDFPTAPGSYAHLARYMMLDRVRIQRKELYAPGPPAPRSQTDPAGPAPTLDPTLHSIPARHKDVRLMEWALRSGEARDPENAFWPAMRAITYFAALRDADALRALDRAAHKSRWDAYIYEEVLGQWRLYSAAYGDIGATQKIAPLSLVAFPHLREMRRMAELARWYAERAADEGRTQEALRIRRNITRLGRTLRDTAQWSIEALFGTDLFFIGNTDSAANLGPAAIRDVSQWEPQARNYLGLLERLNHRGTIAWLRQEAAASCALRQRVDVARFDASYPGTPPGIPLVPLFGNWMVGVSLLQQALALGATALLATLCYRHLRTRPVYQPGLGYPVVLAFLLAFTLLSGFFLFSGEPSPRIAVGFLLGSTILLILGLDALGKVEGDAGDVESQWNHGTTAQFLALLLLPGLAALYLLRPTLSSLHPVAVLLSNLMGVPRALTPAGALEIALLASALPLAIALTACLWAVFRRLPPLVGALVGLRRMAFPALICLALAYLLILGRTLRLDATASRAINEAAQNDLQWVLTHSSPPTDD